MLIQDVKDFPEEKDIPNIFALDTETNIADNHFQRYMKGYSFAYYENKKVQKFYVPVAHDKDELGKYVNVDNDYAIEYLKKLTAERTVIFHNAEFDLAVLEKVGIVIPIQKVTKGVKNRVHDTMLLHNFLDTERKHGLKDIMIEEYKISAIKFDEASRGNFELFYKYAENDAYYTLKLFSDLLQEASKHPKTLRGYLEMEIPFINVTRELNQRKNFIRVDKELLVKYKNRLEHEILSVREQLVKKYGNINFGSTKQLAEAFTEAGIAFPRRKPTAKMQAKGITVGNPQLDEKGLESIYKKTKDDGIFLILYDRTLKKFLSTYVNNLLARVVEYKKGIFCIVGHSHNVIAARTGRLSVTNPPWQTQPRDPLYLKLALQFFLERKFKKDNVKKILENKELFSKFIEAYPEVSYLFEVDMRKVVIPMPGIILVYADYSQIELRMMAHLSKDIAMMEAYNKDLDLHVRTAEFINNKIGRNILNRQKAKTVNFFLQYGGGYRSLAALLGVSEQLAKAIIQAYMELYCGRAQYIRDLHSSGRRSHFVQTIKGRRRNVHTAGINSNDGGLRSWAENGSVSLAVSGSSADLIKVAMINLFYDHSEKITFKLQVHDEILCEVDEDYADEAIEIIKTYMANAIKLDVKVDVDAHKGYTWRAAH